MICMAAERIISIHPRLAAVIEGIVSAVFLLIILRLQDALLVMAWFLIRLVWWSLLVNLVYYPPYISRFKHLTALGFSNVGAVSAVVFSDTSNLLVSQIISFVLPVVSFWLIPASANSLSVMEKPHRRWKFFMAMFGVFGVWLALSALLTFQIISGVKYFYSAIAASILVVGLSVYEWREYGEKFSKKLFKMAAILLLLAIEAAGVVYLWPTGYFVSAFFLTWFWYISWLLFRFNMTDSGINWAKQRFFLLGNALLMSIFLTFIVRWN